MTQIIDDIAVALGRHLFDVVDGPKGWDDTSGYGAGEVAKPAFVVVTSSLPESVRTTNLDAGAAERGLDIDRDAPDLRRLPVIR